MDTSWKKHDTQDPEYQKHVRIWLTVCFALGLAGALALSYKISSAEAAYARQDRKLPAKVQRPQLPPPPADMNKPR